MNYIEWTFDEKSPIYKQLAHRLEYGILSVRLLPEEDIPSIRSMADMLHLNVNTVARSYRLLNQAGLIYTHSNKNYTVTSDNDFVNQKRLQEVRLLCRNYIKARIFYLLFRNTGAVKIKVSLLLHKTKAALRLLFGCSFD